MRREVRELIWRWREVLFALVLVVLAAWWALSSFGFVQWFATALVALGLVLAVAAIQRARFGMSRGGLGAVEVDEGVVSYLTARVGGQVEIADLTAVTLLPAQKGPAYWQLEATSSSPLLIPLDAFGAEKLFDVFVSLEGIKTERMLSHLKAAPDLPVVIWRKKTVTLH